MPGQEVNRLRPLDPESEGIPYDSVTAGYLAFSQTISL
jgi:hypothetical protein